MLGAISGGMFGFGQGFDNMVMQSGEDADKVITAFEEHIRNGEDPNLVEQTVYRQTGVDPSNFTIYDKERITRAVEEAYSAHFNQRG